MIIRLRTAFFITLGALTLWFLYLERAILAPFILAAIFAYIFNPIVSFLSSKIKLPRTISVILIWTIIVAILVFCGTFIVRQAIAEYAGLKEYLQEWTSMARGQVALLPEFVRPTVNEGLLSLQSSLVANSISLFSIFPQAVSGIIGFFIFLISSFYFLKEGRAIFDKFLNFIPGDYRIEVEILLRKINVVLGAYLRGQLLVILSSSLMFFTFFSILGVKYALVLALISGFLEIIIWIGPLVSVALAIIVVLLTGVSNFELSNLQATLVVLVGNFIIRQIQDYVVTPNIMGRAIKLHPLIILFAVLSGGHIAGILGILLAIPTAAVIKVLLEFSLDKINERK
ncbi:MAG: AI-2E family transporter [Candidatus Levyibacteriota bacterium]